MSIFSPSGSLSAAGIAPITITTPTIALVSMPVAGTEYNYTLPNNTRFFRIKAQDKNSVIKLCYISGQSGIAYTKIDPGYTLESPPFGIAAVSLTLYFQASKANEILEIESWV